MSSIQPSAGRTMGDRDLGLAPKPPKRGTGGERSLAVLGIVVGFLGGIVWGIIAWISYSRWQSGRKDYPRFAWFVGLYFLAVMVGVVIVGAIEPDAVVDEEGGYIALGGLVIAAIGIIVMARGPVSPVPGANEL